MRFLFVDAITSVGDGSIVGSRHYPITEPMRYPLRIEQSHVAPGAIFEAIGQLASWYCLKQNNFTARPVFLFVDRIESRRPVPLGSTVELRATIHDLGQDAFRFSGEALVNGEVVQQLDDCGGMFMPLSELEDPEVTKARYQALTNGGLILPGAEGPAYPFADLVGDVLSLEPERRIHTRHLFSRDEPFYADHFPRFPVTPVVILTEMLGQAARHLMGLKDDQELALLAMSRLKIRSFVAPGDIAEVILTSPGVRTLGNRRLGDVTAELLKDGKRILRGDFFYDVTGQ